MLTLNRNKWCIKTGRLMPGFGMAFWKDGCSVALRVLQPATKRYIFGSQLLTTDNILSLTKYCQYFWSFIAKSLFVTPVQASCFNPNV